MAVSGECREEWKQLDQWMEKLLKICLNSVLFNHKLKGI